MTTRYRVLKRWGEYWIERSCDGGDTWGPHIVTESDGLCGQYDVQKSFYFKRSAIRYVNRLASQEKAIVVYGPVP